MSAVGGCAPSGRSEGRSSCAGRGDVSSVDSDQHGGDSRAQIALCDVTGAEHVGPHTVKGIATVGAGEVVMCGRVIRFAIQALNLRFDGFFSDWLHFVFSG